MDSRTQQRQAEERELLSPSSADDRHTLDFELDDYTTSSDEPEPPVPSSNERSFSKQRLHNPPWLPLWFSSFYYRVSRPGSTAAYFSMATGRSRRRTRTRLIYYGLALIPYILLMLIITGGLFFPSYTSPPAHYTALEQRVEESQEAGRANPNNEKIFIAASLYDKEGELVSGNWGSSILGLIDMLGPENVFLSIYENDPDSLAQEALDAFAETVPCNSSITSEHLDNKQLPHILTPDGTFRLRRIAYLAEVRNRALRPLEDTESPAHSVRFEKLLYINDISFDPIDAAHLLLSTNLDPATGRTDYRAACAADFINPFKYYDTFATRDAEGNTAGVPFFPWFTNAGEGTSRRDVIGQKDAVRVKSCWGGMVAFEAKWFQAKHQLPTVEATEARASLSDTNTPNLPLRFRVETDTFWDSSECCLIHADLEAASPPSDRKDTFDTGIYFNPYIRVAYSAEVLNWLRFTRRFERLYPPVQNFVNWLVGAPAANPRRLQQAGEEVENVVWMWEQETLDAMKAGNLSGLPHGVQGQWRSPRRRVLPGGFCGGRKLLVLNEHPEDGQASWQGLPWPDET